MRFAEWWAVFLVVTLPLAVVVLTAWAFVSTWGLVAGSFAFVGFLLASGVISALCLISPKGASP